ncbi:hypothetical protein CHS0354_035276 [Potamilus streckersoni]|uniref:OmpA-like domain-containing protein n=1 Tax=Potamilus streckersoni TaxID=2493646 RepID=A0AAE0S2T3_9BIVA|nr:hypothetical protein CHS0354_035276 [Potamilus streckersoni]
MIETIMVINDISKLARKNILGIEDALPGIENNMLRGGLRMILDRAERSLIQRVLAAEIAKQELEYNKMIAVHKFLALMAPGFGMTGTLIGMINLLRSLEDPSKVGPAMSVALVATLYGSVMGNIVFMPFALKITGYRDSVIALNKMIMEGVLLIEKTERPEHIEQALLSYFPADERHEEHEEIEVEETEELEREIWIYTYADMITLLMCFFVILYASKNQTKEVLQAISLSLRGGPPASPYVFSGGPSVLERFEANLQSSELLEDITVTIDDRGITAQLGEAVIFEQGSAVIPNSIIVEGHSDVSFRGNQYYPSGWDLSAARASRVANLLQQYGISPARIEVAAYGSTRPRVIGTTAERVRVNNRVEILIRPDDGPPPQVSSPAP